MSAARRRSISPDSFHQPWRSFSRNGVPVAASPLVARRSFTRLQQQNEALRPFGRAPNSASNLVESRHVPLPMNPNDSPRRSAYGPPISETPQSSGPYNPGMLASPIVSRREFAPYPPHAQQGKMLVDPQTGQQYFVPNVASQAVHAPQVAYYPVFYNTPQPTPQPLFYAAPQPWGNSALPSPPVQSAHQPNFFAHPYYPPNGYMHHNPPQHPTASTTASTPYHVEIPPSSAVSVVDEPNGPSPFFRRNHNGRLSNDSTGSDRHAYAHSDDSMSPRVQYQQPATTAIPPLMEHSARYSTASSSTTSGFASAAGDGPPEAPSVGRPAVLRSTIQRPQLHGFPEWWGEETNEPKSQSDRTPTTCIPATHSAKSLTSSQQVETPTISPTSEGPRTSTSSVVQKAIRMDFDLKSATTQDPTKQDTKVSTPRVAPTAFTVNFDSEDEKPKRGKPALSSEATNRRLARRSVPPARTREGELLAQTTNSQDPKRYLLSKMLQGFGGNADAETDDGEGSHVDRENTRCDMDSISETGTYVIQGKGKLRRDAQRARTRDLDSQSSVCSSSSSSTATNPTTQRSPTTGDSVNARSTNNTRRTSSTTRPIPPEQPQFPMRRSLMKDLRELRAQNQPKAAVDVAALKVRSVLDSNKSSRLGVSSTSNTRSALQPPATTRPATTSTPSALRRTEFGRFSMRTTPTPSTASGSRGQTVKNPPFRAGIAPTKTNTNVESPEMIAWLRRKAYDPRKSAAEARQMQQLKVRGDNFFANRSVSYNQPHNSGFNRLLRPIGDERSNKSTDDLSHLTEEVDDFSMGGSNSNLNRTIDELTQKCQRSMQLLKLCNSNALTDSVEQLLDMVDEQSEDGDDPMNRLQRLSDAFTALQKCLEDTANSRTSSPRNPQVSAKTKQPILSTVVSAPPNFGTKNREPESPESGGSSPTSF